MKIARMTNRVLVIALVAVLIGAMLPLGALTGHSQVRAAPATIYVPDDYPTIQATAYKAPVGDATTMGDGSYGTTSTYHMLTVDVTGSGTVTSDPPGIDCRTDCSALYEEGTWVSLTATADNGWISMGTKCDHITDQAERQLCELENHRGGAPGRSFQTRVLIDQAKNVTFRFVPGGIVEVSRIGSGTIVSSPRGIDCGCDCSELFFGDPRIVTLTALPATGATFLGWEGDCSGSGDCILDTGYHHTDVVARFTEGGQFTLAVNKIGSGTVTSSPAGINCGSDCSEPYEDGTPVTLTFSPDPGWGIRSLWFEGSCTWVDQQLFDLERHRHGGALPTYTVTLRVLQPETVTVYFVPVDTPIARASDISGQEKVMYPNTPYTVTAKYFDPDGREDLKYCYLRLKHPSKNLTMMWDQATDDFWVYETEMNYLSVSGKSTSITEGGLEGYELAWTFSITDQWPEVENAIDFGVYAWDDSDLKTGWNYDNTKASFRLTPGWPPSTPHYLLQYVKDGPEIPVDGMTDKDCITFILVSDTEGSRVKFQIELRRLDEYAGSFLGEHTHESGSVDSGYGVIDVYGLTPGYYHWQARAIDEHGLASAWVAFADFANRKGPADFKIRILSMPYSHGSSHASSDFLGYDWATIHQAAAQVDKDTGQGTIGLIALAKGKTLGGGTAWASASFTLQDSWKSTLTGDYNLIASFRMSGVMHVVKISTILYGANEASGSLKASLKVSDKTQGTVVLEQDLIIFEERTEWWEKIPIIGGGLGYLKGKAVAAKTFKNDEFVIHDVLSLKENHEYEYTLTMRMDGEAAAVLADAAWVDGLVDVVLAEIRIEQDGDPPKWFPAIDLPFDYPSTNENLHLYVLCPVVVMVTDPEGKRIGVDFNLTQEVNEIPGGWYSGLDTSAQVISIPAPLMGAYTVHILGMDSDLYGFTLAYSRSHLGSDEEAIGFVCVGIPTSSEAIHQYIIDWDALASGENGVTVSVDSDGDGVFEKSFTAGSVLTGDQFILSTETFIDFDPDVLNLRARSGLVTVYIELPEGFDVNEIDVSSIRLNGTLPVLSRPTAIGDYNDNGIPDLMVKFDRRAVHEVVEVGESVEIAITGEVDGIPFMAVDTIRVIGQ